MPGWNFADVWEVVAEQIPDAPAQVQGDRRVTWREFDRRADGVAQHAARRRASSEQDKVAQYLYNGPEYLESMFAAFKAGLVPGQHQLPLRRRRARLPVGQRRRRRRRVPRHVRRAHRAHPRPGAAACRLWLWVDDGAGPCPDVGDAVRGRRRRRTAGRVAAPWGRDGDHLYCSTPAAPPACPRA